MLNIDQDSQPEHNKTTIREGVCLDNAIEFDVPKSLSRKLAAADLVVVRELGLGAAGGANLQRLPGYLIHSRDSQLLHCKFADR